MRIHLVNVTQEEGALSIETHGHIIDCTAGDCDLAAVAMLLMKPPTAAWGQQIDATAYCDDHETWLLEQMSALHTGGKVVPS